MGDGVVEDEQVKLESDDKEEEEEEEEEEGDYFQDLTDICKYLWWEMHVFIHLFPSLSSLSQCQSLTQYPLRGSQSM